MQEFVSSTSNPTDLLTKFEKNRKYSKNETEKNRNAIKQCRFCYVGFYAATILFCNK